MSGLFFLASLGLNIAGQDTASYLAFFAFAIFALVRKTASIFEWALDAAVISMAAIGVFLSGEVPEYILLILIIILFANSEILNFKNTFGLNFQAYTFIILILSFGDIILFYFFEPYYNFILDYSDNYGHLKSVSGRSFFNEAKLSDHIGRPLGLCLSPYATSGLLVLLSILNFRKNNFVVLACITLLFGYSSISTWIGFLMLLGVGALQYFYGILLLVIVAPVAIKARVEDFSLDWIFDVIAVNINWEGLSLFKLFFGFWDGSFASTEIRIVNFFMDLGILVLAILAVKLIYIPRQKIFILCGFLISGWHYSVLSIAVVPFISVLVSRREF